MIQNLLRALLSSTSHKRHHLVLLPGDLSILQQQQQNRTRMRRETHKISEHLAVRIAERWGRDPGTQWVKKKRKRKSLVNKKIKEGLIQLHVRGVCSGWRRVAGDQQHCSGYGIFRGLWVSTVKQDLSGSSPESSKRLLQNPDINKYISTRWFTPFWVP